MWIVRSASGNDEFGDLQNHIESRRRWSVFAAWVSRSTCEWALAARHYQMALLDGPCVEILWLQQSDQIPALFAKCCRLQKIVQRFLFMKSKQQWRIEGRVLQDLEVVRKLKIREVDSVCWTSCTLLQKQTKTTQLAQHPIHTLHAAENIIRSLTIPRKQNCCTKISLPSAHSPTHFWGWEECKRSCEIDAL